MADPRKMGKLETIMEKQNKYTASIVAQMVASQPLNWDKCVALAAEFNRQTGTADFTPKGVVAKAGRDHLEYVNKTPVSKTGDPIANKDAIVTEIEAVLGQSLDGLNKASKQALQRVRAFVVAHQEAA